MGMSRKEVSGEAGMVTAETAVAMPAVIGVLALAMSLLGAGACQLQVTEAARVAARGLAAGQEDVSTLARVAGADTIQVERTDLVCVTATKRLPGPLAAVREQVSSRACVWTEPDGGPP